MSINKINAIPLRFEINYNNSKFIYSEFFQPYNRNDILSNTVLMNSYSTYIELFSTFNEQCVFPSFIRPEPVELNRINEIGYVILDVMPIAIKMAYNHGLLSNFIDEQHIDFLYDFFELYKIFLQDLKLDFSILFNLTNIVNQIENNKQLEEIAIKFLTFIVSKYNLQIATTSPFSLFLHQIIISLQKNYTNHIFIFNITNNKFEILISFLDILKNSSFASEYYDGNRCFALTEADEIYYTISKNDFSETYTKLSPEKMIGTDLSKVFPNYIFNYCQVTAKTKTYAYRNNQTKNFIVYENPIEFGTGINPLFHNIKAQFACCERKIFSNLKKNGIHLTFYCKYKPCIECQLAIFDEYAHGTYSISFDFFYEDKKDFMGKTKGLIKQNINLYDTNALKGFILGRIK